MTKPGTEADKGEKWSRSAIAEWLAAAKANIMYIGVNLYAKNTTYHTQNYTLWMLSHPHYPWQESAKATSQLDCIHRRSALQGTAKAKAMRYAFLPKRTGRNKNISTIALPASRDCRAKAAATAPQRVHGGQCGLTENHHSQSCVQDHKKPPHARQESQCARRLKAKWWTARKGGLGRIPILILAWKNCC